MSDPSLPKSGFSENLLRINDLLDSFSAWVFYPGMLFHAGDVWWKDGKRSRPHEGLDLCYYRDRGGAIRSLHREILIPVMYEGDIAKRESDFLGESVYVRHTLCPGGDMQFYSVYGHVTPSHLTVCGTKLRQGDILGRITDVSGKNHHIPSHLHITVALASGNPSLQQLSWSAIHDNNLFTLIDPLGLLDGNFEVLYDAGSPGMY